ncbi:hypothetical protein CLOSTASPAR_03539 [[Clostridium] asparagiforme DSM 15981]|uniref:Uncharacterized protein n=1 Tax=[Clostridium] asparagiforme DSM 15981 TaxID=518636 RepID=C0D2Q0_9FIRM|nr:hypothetical protein CLOSTASPAR_03539 [[Clostridium] asparagiforme DSM 15981]
MVMSRLSCGRFIACRSNARRAVSPSGHLNGYGLCKDRARTPCKNIVKQEKYALTNEPGYSKVI